MDTMGVDPQVRTQSARTPLHFAVARAQNVDLLKYLVQTKGVAHTKESPQIRNFYSILTWPTRRRSRQPKGREWLAAYPCRRSGPLHQGHRCDLGVPFAGTLFPCAYLEQASSASPPLSSNRKAIMFLIGDCGVHIEEQTDAGEKAIDLARLNQASTPSKDVVDWLSHHSPKRPRMRGGIAAEEARVAKAAADAEEAERMRQRGDAGLPMPRSPLSPGKAPTLPSRSEAPKAPNTSPVRYAGSPPRVGYTGS